MCCKVDIYYTGCLLSSERKEEIIFVWSFCISEKRGTQILVAGKTSPWWGLEIDFGV